jgi:hypothetical protein
MEWRRANAIIPDTSMKNKYDHSPAIEESEWPEKRRKIRCQEETERDRPGKGREPEGAVVV